jgi:hypothetical protein
LGGTPNPAVRYIQTDAEFVQYFVSVTDHGAEMQIGYDGVTKVVDQAFPVRLLQNSKIDLDQFDRAQMNAIKTAPGKWMQNL